MIYSLVFKIYDKVSQLSNINKYYDIVFIGSSNILWAVDTNMLESATQKKVGMLALAGGNIEFRYHVLKEYLERNKHQLPERIVIHTDKFVLSKSRYSGESYKSIQGYYHQGLLQEYLSDKWKSEGNKNYFLKRIFKTYTLNSQSFFILSRLMDKLPISNLLGLALFTSVYAEEANKNYPPKDIDKESALKIEKWASEYKKLENTPKKDKEYEDVFFKMISLVNSYNVKVILLETPVFNFDSTSNDGFDEVRKLFLNAENDKIRYLRLEPEFFESNISLYFDASHLNIDGRIAYTKKLGEIFIQTSIF